MPSKAKEGETSNFISNTSPIPTTRSTTIWRASKILTAVVIAVSAVGYIGIERYLTRGGPFTPWTCSVFGYKCDSRYDVSFRGYVDDDYAAAAQTFKENFYAGEEVGAAVSAYVDGKLVLDLQGGWQNVEEQIPYTDKTLQITFSSTKALVRIVFFLSCLPM